MSSSINSKEHPALKGMRSSLLGVIVNFLLGLIKIIAGLLGHSFALVADGIESFTDVVSGLAVYFGLRLAIEPADKNHPYGHGKAEPLATLLVGLFLVGAAIAIMAEAIHEIRTPHRLPASYTLMVLTGILFVKGFLSRHVHRIAQTIGSTVVSADAAHHFSDAITSAFAFVGISLGLLKNWPTADDWAALGAGFVILFNAYKQMRPAVLELADIAPDSTIESKLRQISAAVPGVIAVEKCAVRKMGFSYYADLHVIVHGTLSVREGHKIAHKVKDSIREQLPQVAEVLVHIEPEESLHSEGGASAVRGTR